MIVYVCGYVRDYPYGAVGEGQRRIMTPVYFPDTRTETGTGCVDSREFVDQVHLLWRSRAPALSRNHVKAVVYAVARWLRAIIAQASQRGEDPAAAVLRANDPMQLPPCVKDAVGDDAHRRRMAHFVVDRLCRTTARELPFWGCDRIRRANRLFAKAYPVVGDDHHHHATNNRHRPPPLRRRRVHFGAVTERLV